MNPVADAWLRQNVHTKPFSSLPHQKGRSDYEIFRIYRGHLFLGRALILG
jgi:hypothetical protein